MPVGAMGGFEVGSGGNGGNGRSTGIGGWSLFEELEGTRATLAGGCNGMEDTRGGGLTKPSEVTSGNAALSLAVRENLRSLNDCRGECQIRNTEMRRACLTGEG